MLSYVNNFKHDVVSVSIEDILFNLKFDGWYDSVLGSYSPVDVLKNPKKYKHEMEKINKANLKYPIMLDGNNIADGVHRVCKAILSGKTHINAYRFDKELMKKFLISSKGDRTILMNMEPYEFIDLFMKRFKI